jgi:hypothetical protein
MYTDQKTDSPWIPGFEIPHIRAIRVIRGKKILLIRG